jgi:hypothetical protein
LNYLFRPGFFILSILSIEVYLFSGKAFHSNFQGTYLQKTSAIAELFSVWLLQITSRHSLILK